LRLRRKPWIGEALEEYRDIVYKNPDDRVRGCWQGIFGDNKPLYVELGTGKGRFITEMAARHPDINFIGIEAQADVLYYAAKKAREKGLTNIRLLVFDINHITDIFAPGEVGLFYINFCDPWPKNRHAKRRLTHAGFLEKYRSILPMNGQIFFKTDNEKLFEFSLNEFAGAGLRLGNIALDLHNSRMEGNVMTEYEEKFSKLGMKIYRCEVTFI
jgi:tRNA (guanine-N7-)-methyltransferase